MIKCSFWQAFWGCIRLKSSHPLTLMLDCHSPKEEMFLRFCRQMVQICPHLCCFLSILKTTPNISSLASFYSSRRKCTERLGASLYALITFRATSNAIQGGSWNFCRDAGKGDQAFVERVLEGTSSPKSHASFPRGITLENLCTRKVQSSRGVRSRRVHKIYYFGLLWSILWASTLQFLIFTRFFSFGIIA